MLRLIPRNDKWSQKNSENTLQQTRNQITSLAAEAIVALAEQDERRAQMRKTKREIRAKYGW